MSNAYLANIQYNIQPKKSRSVRNNLHNYSFEIELKIPESYNDKDLIQLIIDKVDTIPEYKVIHSPKVLSKVSLDLIENESAMDKFIRCFPKN